MSLLLNTAKRWIGRTPWLVGCILLFMATGCQWAPKASKSIWPWKKDEAKPLPDRILAVWTDTILHQPNQPGIRGFGGRLYFYLKENTDPIEVDGSMAIYVFDAEDLSPSAQKPLRKFVFTAEQFASHMSKTSIGPSYSVWLPWGEVGGPPQRLSLIARFEGKEGGTTISDPTIKLLPGVPAHEEPDSANPTQANTAKKKQSESKENPTVRLAGHAETTPPASEAPVERTDVQTIELPPAFQRHLRHENGTPPSTPIPPSTSSLPSSTRVQRLVQGKEAGSLIQEGEGEVDDEEESPPVTTQVFDYRNRNRFQAKNSPRGTLPKSNIRDGKWIESISR